MPVFAGKWINFNTSFLKTFLSTTTTLIWGISYNIASHQTELFISMCIKKYSWTPQRCTCLYCCISRGVTSRFQKIPLYAHACSIRVLARPDIVFSMRLAVHEHCASHNACFSYRKIFIDSLALTAINKITDFSVRITEIKLGEWSYFSIVKTIFFWQISMWISMNKKTWTLHSWLYDSSRNIYDHFRAECTYRI